MSLQQAALAFVGAGALGQAFAAFLAANNQPVTILATEARAAQLHSDRLVRLSGMHKLAVPIAAVPAPAGAIGITTDPTQVPVVEGLIFTTKAHQLMDAITRVSRAWEVSGDRAGWVAGAQNGLLKDTMLIEAWGRERSVGMVTSLAAQRDCDGQIKIRSLGMTYLGEFEGGGSARLVAATAALNQAGIPASVADDIQSVLWTKACHAAGMFGSAAPARASIASLMASPDLARAYLALVRESASIAHAHGIAIGDYAGFPIRTYLDQPESETLALFAERAAGMRGTGGSDSYASMAHDVVSGRALEVEEIFGDLVRRAEAVGVAVPRLALIRDILRGIDPGR